METYFAYEDGQIVLQWEDADGVGGDDPVQTKRYLWAEAVDFFLAAEIAAVHPCMITPPFVTIEKVRIRFSVVIRGWL